MIFSWLVSGLLVPQCPLQQRSFLLSLRFTDSARWRCDSEQVVCVAVCRGFPTVLRLQGRFVGTIPTGRKQVFTPTRDGAHGKFLKKWPLSSILRSAHYRPRSGFSINA